MGHLKTGSVQAAPRAGHGRLGTLDWAGITASLLVLLVISYLRSRHLMFWGDEIMGWTMLREDDLGRFYKSWSEGADSSGLFYHFLGRAWLTVFGATELAARMFTAVGLWVSLALTWAAARRHYSSAIVSFCIPFAFVSNEAIIFQLSNARTYGLFMAAASAVAYMFLSARPGVALTPRLLLSTALAHAFLIGSHVLGVVYSGLFVAGLIVQDLWYRKLRWKLYASAFCGWIILFWVWRNLRANVDIGKPYFWTERPLLSDLPLGMAGYGTPTLVLCCILLATAYGAHLARKAMNVQEDLIPSSRTPLYFLIGTLLSASIIFFMKSLVGNSVFVDRYLLPTLVGSALLLCDLTSRLLVLTGKPRIAGGRVVLAVLLLAAFCLRSRPRDNADNNYTTALVRKIPVGIPAVTTDVNIFAELVHYQNQHAKLETEVDWPFTLDMSHGPT